MVKKLSLVLATLALAACVANDNESSSSSNLSQFSSISSSLTSASESSLSSDSSLAVSSFNSSSSQIIIVSSSSSVLVDNSSLSSLESTSSVSTSSEGTASSSSISPGAADGKVLYEAHCLECHGVVGAGTLKIPVPIANTTYSTLMAKVDGGNMPTGKGPLTREEYFPENCVDECATKVASYITSGFPGALNTGGDTELGFNGCADAEGAPAGRAMRLLTRREYQNTINDIFGFDMDLTVNFSPEGRDHGFTNNADIAQVTARDLDNYYSAASRVTARIQQNLDSGKIREVVGCKDNFVCMEKFVRGFGERLFRRPLSEAEVEEYLSFFTAFLPAGANRETYYNHSQLYPEAIGAGVPALLMSPHFLYRRELGQKEGDVYRLDNYEMASLISYTFTGSSPDDALMQAANEGKLQTKAEFKAQAERLLATERGKTQMAHFAVEWWDSGLELIGSKNPDFYANYDADVIQAMVGEMEAFFKHVVFESTGKFEELYQPGYTLLNNRLSEFYGIGSGLGDNFSKVTTEQRGGILSFGAIMASKASTEESSPVKRGVFVREQLMCDPLPPLPRDVNIPNPDLDPTKPMRERFTEHSANDNCWACHKFFDDIGFAMEIYDASGKFRDREIMYDWDSKAILRELDIITDGKVISVDGNDEHFFDDLDGLSSILASSNSAKSCMSTQYYRYVMGYSLSEADQCAIKNLNKTFADSEFDIQALLIGITQLDSFSLRQ